MRSRYPNVLASQYSSPAPTDSVFVPPHFGHDVAIRAGESIPDEARNAQASWRGGESGRSADLQVCGKKARNTQGRWTARARLRLGFATQLSGSQAEYGQRKERGARLAPLS